MNVAPRSKTVALALLAAVAISLSAIPISRQLYRFDWYQRYISQRVSTISPQSHRLFSIPDFTAYIHKDVLYKIRVDGVPMLLLIHSFDNQSLTYELTGQDGVRTSRHFPAWNPRAEPDEPMEIPVILLGNSIIHIVPPNDIVLDAGPDRVNLRVYAETITIEPAA